LLEIGTSGTTKGRRVRLKTRSIFDSREVKVNRELTFSRLVVVYCLKHGSSRLGVTLIQFLCCLHFLQWFGFTNLYRQKLKCYEMKRSVS